jgi:protein gp37
MNDRAEEQMMDNASHVPQTEVALAEHAAAIRALGKRVVADIVEIGRRLTEAKRLAGHGNWLPWLDREFGWSDDTAERFMSLHRLQGQIPQIAEYDLPVSGLYLLARPNMEEAREAVIERAERGESLSVKDVKNLIDEERKKQSTESTVTGLPWQHRPLSPNAYSVPAWDALSKSDRERIIKEAKGNSQFNEQNNDSIEWARWSWNPVTGCLHNCRYCYARDIANRFYEQRFEPTFLPDRLMAPSNTKLPAQAATEIGYRNVFVTSMGDLFGKWVPDDWIEAVFNQVRTHPQWNFLFLTKFPQRLAEREWPVNAWCGTTVDTQARVKIAERAFRDVKAGYRWLSVEPMLERLTFTSLEMFNWLVIGGATKSTQTSAFDPPMEWVLHLLHQAQAAGIERVYSKANLSALRGYPSRSLG